MMWKFFQILYYGHVLRNGIEEVNMFLISLYFKDPLNIFNKNFQLRGQKFSVKFSETAIFKFTS